jgi:hypothetical protein
MYYILYIYLNIRVYLIENIGVADVPPRDVLDLVQ